MNAMEIEISRKRTSVMHRLNIHLKNCNMYFNDYGLSICSVPIGPLDQSTGRYFCFICSLHCEESVDRVFCTSIEVVKLSTNSLHLRALQTQILISAIYQYGGRQPEVVLFTRFSSGRRGFLMK
jgi:hypothetical protein